MKELKSRIVHYFIGIPAKGLCGAKKGLRLYQDWQYKVYIRNGLGGQISSEPYYIACKTCAKKFLKSRGQHSNA
jgi:hypothetical protein